MGAPSPRRPIRLAGSLACLVALTAFAGLGAGGQQAKGAVRPAPAIADKRPTQKEWNKRFERLCVARKRAIHSLGVPFTSPADYAVRGPDLIRIEHNFDRAGSAVPLPAEHRLIDRAWAEYHRYLHLLPSLVTAARRNEPRAWLIMYDADGHSGAAGSIVRRLTGGHTNCTA
jgi:hypothetical protein